MRKVVETQFDTFKEVVACIAVMVHKFSPQQSFTFSTGY